MEGDAVNAGHGGIAEHSFELRFCDVAPYIVAVGRNHAVDAKREQAIGKDLGNRNLVIDDQVAAMGARVRRRGRPRRAPERWAATEGRCRCGESLST
jgi:hypothetical protein